MADIATVFGWSTDVMDPMPLPELMAWREKAAKRHQPTDKSGTR